MFRDVAQNQPKRVLGCAIPSWKSLFWTVFQAFLETWSAQIGVSRNFGRVFIDWSLRSTKMDLFVSCTFVKNKVFTSFAYFDSQKIVKHTRNKPKRNFGCYVPSWKIRLWGSSNTLSHLSDKNCAIDMKSNLTQIIKTYIFRTSFSLLGKSFMALLLLQIFGKSDFCCILIMMNFRHPLC